MGLTKQQAMPELWALRKALNIAIDTENEKSIQYRSDEMVDAYRLVVKWIDQFFEPDPEESRLHHAQRHIAQLLHLINTHHRDDPKQEGWQEGLEHYIRIEQEELKTELK